MVMARADHFLTVVARMFEPTVVAGLLNLVWTCFGPLHLEHRCSQTGAP